MRSRSISRSDIDAGSSEHSLQHGSNASAISYVETSYPSGKLFGASISTNIVGASLEAIVSAANRCSTTKASLSLIGGCLAASRSRRFLARPCAEIQPTRVCAAEVVFCDRESAGRWIL